MAPKLTRQEFVFKLKDKKDRNHFDIANKASKYMVIERVVVSKVPNENNKVRITLVMPVPELVDVVVKETKKGEPIK